MTITPREQRILLCILDSSSPLTSENIANQIGVSKRTVQRECESIEYYLKSFDLELVKKKRVGMFIEGTATQKSALRKSLVGVNDIDVTNIRQRRVYLILELLKDRTPKKRIYLADLLGVSEATISTDLEAIQPWLEKNHLKIEKKPGYGITVTGKEADYREAVRRYINDFESVQSIPYKKDILVSALLENTNEGMYSLLNSDVITRVDRVLKTMKEVKLDTLTDEAYVSLVLHISISIIRIQKGGIVESNQESLESLKEYESYELAEQILRMMETEFNIQIPRVEISYLLLHIEGSKINYTRSNKNFLDTNFNEDLVLELVNKMADAFDATMARDLKKDHVFTRGLVVHLQPVLVRLKNNMNIFNPLLEDIKREYPDIFQKCLNASKVITEYTGYRVSEEEVGYLAMHFGAAVQRLKNRNHYHRQVYIGVVCASGFGVAQLMMTKLRNLLGDGVILQPFGKEDIGTPDTEDIDFYVTSFNLDSLEIDYVQVNPLIQNQDVEKIEHKIEDYSHVHKKVKVKNNVENKDIGYLTNEINRIVQNFQEFIIPDESSFDDVAKFLSQTVTSSPKNEEKIMEMIYRREKMYSQVLPEISIALLHGTSDAVQNTHFYICAPESGERFTNPYFKGIRRIIFMVIPVDEHLTVNMNMFGFISSSFVENQHFSENVLYKEEEEIKESLQSVLQAYFFDYVAKKNL